MVLWHAGQQGPAVGAKSPASASPLSSATGSPLRPGVSPRSPFALSLSMGGSLDSADTMPNNQIRIAADGTVTQYVEPGGGDDGDEVTQFYGTGREECCCPGEGFISSKATSVVGKAPSYAREGYSFGETGTVTMSREMSYSVIQSVE